MHPGIQVELPSSVSATFPKLLLQTYMETPAPIPPKPPKPPEIVGLIARPVHTIAPPKPTTPKHATPKPSKPKPQGKPKGALAKPAEGIAPTTQNVTETEQNTPSMFQAIGCIVGEIDLVDKTICIGGKHFPLFYASSKPRVLEYLKRECDRTSSTTVRLLVYPKITHFPDRDKSHKIGFQVVGFDRGDAFGNLKERTGVFAELDDFEFKLCGLWQFIPVCRTPCVTVLRNWSEQRKEHILKADISKRVKFLKASHIPLMWRDSPVQPFRFNPKVSAEELGKPNFVEVKARFSAEREMFYCVEALKSPQAIAPRFLKARKEDKAEALRVKKGGSDRTSERVSGDGVNAGKPVSKKGVKKDA